MPTTPNNDPALDDGSRGAAADPAAKDRAKPEARHIEAEPHARRAEPLSKKKHDQLAEKAEQAENRQEALLDEALEETFPGSDPISPKNIT